MAFDETSTSGGSYLADADRAVRSRSATTEKMEVVPGAGCDIATSTTFADLIGRAYLRIGCQDLYVPHLQIHSKGPY